jgi:hypothetical protein
MATGCAECGRHVDPGRRCPYCGSYRPLPHRLLRYASLLLAGIGLAALYLAARGREAPTVRIGDITPLMGFANIAVTGCVTRTPFIGAAGDYVMFRVDDGTGELQVLAHGAVAAALIAAHRIPAAGRAVRVSGEIGLSARRGTRLYLRDARDLTEPTMPTPTPMPTAAEP